jgi:3-hydroxyacyl-[acyl-carrier-protein] dehydratase
VSGRRSVVFNPGDHYTLGLLGRSRRGKKTPLRLRMRFCLIDRITQIDDQRVCAIKNLSLAEEYLQDHFPGFPVIPGVLMLEAMVQTSAWLMRRRTGFQYSTILLKEAKALKFNSFLQPGRTLSIESELHKEEGAQATFKVAGTVDGTSTVSARLTLKQFNLAEQNPKLADADRRNLEYLKSLYQQLWTESAT